jgi:hypothetical protein
MFPNVEITVLRETPNGTVIGINEDGTDKLVECPMTGYDQQSKCLYPINTYIGNFTPNVTKELQQQYGHITQSLYMISIDDITVDILYKDKIKIKYINPNVMYDDNDIYQVLGDPKYFDNIIPHIECPVMKER